MQADSLLYLFRGTAILLFVSLAVFHWQFFIRKEKKIRRLGFISGLLTIVCVLFLFGIIIYTANTDLHIQNIKQTPNHKVSERMIERAQQNSIFQDVQVFVGSFVHLAIVCTIGLVYIYLWRRTRYMPRTGYTLAHKILLFLGSGSVAAFAIYALYKCITDTEFREQVYFRTYSEYFVGNIFLMLVASMVAAAGAPDEEERKG
jgi:zinc transporter ZupT